MIGSMYGSPYSTFLFVTTIPSHILIKFASDSSEKALFGNTFFSLVRLFINNEYNDDSCFSECNYTYFGEYISVILGQLLMHLRLLF